MSAILATKRTVLELRGISATKRTLRRFGTFQCWGLSGYAALVLNLEGHDEAARVHHADRWRRGRFVMRCASTTACEAGYRVFGKWLSRLFCDFCRCFQAGDARQRAGRESGLYA